MQHTKSKRAPKHLRHGSLASQHALITRPAGTFLTTIPGTTSD